MQPFTGQLLRRHLFVLLAALLAIGCVAWRPEPVSVAGSRAAERLPSRVRIVTADGRSMLLWDPSLRNDSLIGTRRGSHSGDTETVRVARTEIRSFDARRPSVGGSFMMFVGIVGGVIVALTVLGDES